LLFLATKPPLQLAVLKAALLKTHLTANDVEQNINPTADREIFHML